MILNGISISRLQLQASPLYIDYYTLKFKNLQQLNEMSVLHDCAAEIVKPNEDVLNTKAKAVDDINASTALALVFHIIV